MEVRVPTDSIFDAPANHPRLAEARQSLGGEIGKSSKTFSRRGFMRKGLGIGTALLLPNLPGSIPVGSAAPAHDDRRNSLMETHRGHGDRPAQWQHHLPIALPRNDHVFHIHTNESVDEQLARACATR